MKILIEELTEKQKEILKNRAAYEVAHHPLDAEKTVRVCDNCRNLITFEQKSGTLPTGVFYSRYYFGNRDYDILEVCVDCHNAMEEKIAMVFEKYGRKRREKGKYNDRLV